MSLTHKTLKSDNPSERSLLVTIGEASLATAGGSLPPEGSLYGSSVWKTLLGADYRKSFADFVYTEQGDDTKNGGTVLFAKNKTVAQAMVPYRTLTRKGNHYWHTILVKLTPVLVSGFPLAVSVGSGSTNTNAARYVMREVYIPAATEGTIFKTEYFSSPRPFSIGKSRVPIASAVTYDLINRRGGFPECLHDKLVIPAVSTITGQSLPAQIFPETNFTTWEPYILTDDQKLVNGVYLRERVTCFPPPFPEEVVRTA